MTSEGIKSALAAFIVLAMAGCSHLDRIPPPPVDLASSAEIPGMPGVRYREDDQGVLLADALAAEARQRAWRESQGETEPPPPSNFLAISGGGENGAFGAGLLIGWTEAGTRPEFNLVTGISTGALTAPFAFLGPDYDDQLREVYTTISLEDVAEMRDPFAAVNSDAMADNAPLRQLVSRYADEDLLRAIAREHEKGRLFLVGTTNLDARSGVIWNMGKIAASGHPDSLALFRDVLVASAAVPGALPPVMFDVEVNGRPYQELHVDGGITTQVFVYPTWLDLSEIDETYDIEARERRLYLIRNSRLLPDAAPVERETMEIAGRSISMLLKTQGFADLFWIYAIAQRDGVDYNLAFIGDDFDVPKPGPFDTGYMNALFDHGYELARAGLDWDKAPPGFAE